MTRISGPTGSLILAADLRHPLEGGGYGPTHRYK